MATSTTPQRRSMLSGAHAHLAWHAQRLLASQEVCVDFLIESMYTHDLMWFHRRIGEIDMQVPSSLSHLNVIAPQPHNNSAILPSPVKIGTLLKPKGGYARYVVNALLSFVLSSGESGANQTAAADNVVVDSASYQDSTVANNTQQTASVTVDVDAEFQFEDNVPNSSQRENAEAAAAADTTKSTAVPLDQGPTESEDLTKKKHPYSSVTMDSWALNMAPYAEPPHVSVRTSQMAGVGFPVDHLALLWCNQVLKAVNSYMKKIVIAGHQADVDMASIVKLKSEFKVTAPDDVIPPLVAYLERNASQAMYSGLAVDLERAAMHVILNKSTMWLIATVFNTSYISAIATCFVLVPLLVMATAMLHDVADKKGWAPRPKSDFEALLPANHLFLGILDDIFMILCPQLYCFLKANAAYIVAPVIAVCIGMMALDYSDPVLFLHRYGLYFQWGVAYGVAVAMHMVFIGLVTAARAIFAFCASIVYGLLRWTIWCNLVQRGVKAATKPLTKLVKPLYEKIALEYLLAALSLSAAMVGVVIAKERVQGTLGFILVCTSVCYIVATATFLFVFAMAVVWKPKRSSKLLLPTLALYFPAILLSKPSLLFCWSMLFDKLSVLTAMSRVYNIFGPELINYTLCMICIVCHLTMSLR
jgi:hypothetical protein